MSCKSQMSDSKGAMLLLQTIEVHVRREDDSQYYSDLDIKQRVHLHVDALEMMPYNLNEISSSPLG